MESSYYPPRARWYSGLLVPWNASRRILRLDQAHFPSGVAVLKFLLSVVLPAHAFFTNGRRVLGWGFLGAYLASGILFLVALGYAIGNLGFGLLIAAHASNIIYLESCWLREGSRFAFRVVLALITVMAVLSIYSTINSFVGDHWIMPLQVKGNVVVVRRLASGHALKPGDRIVYSFQQHESGDRHGDGGAVVVGDGFGYGAVLASAGDRVAFSKNVFTVNGVARKPLARMPTDGELIVPANHWFVWPELTIPGNARATEAAISEVILQLADVSEAQLIGKPFKRWFGRRQIL